MRILFPVLLLLCSCASFTTKDEASIRAVMQAQEQAWDSGDIPGFMEGYADTICFHSPQGLTCGKEQVTANYLKSYPDKSVMGDLTFAIDEVLPAGAHNAWLTGKWTLHRTADTVGGYFTLLWAKEQNGWRIVRDHTY